MKALIDNDVILKSARYSLMEVLLPRLPPPDEPIGVLGSARFVLAGFLEKSKDPAAPAVLASVLTFINENVTLEPTHEELHLAAEFEASAQVENLFLDAGESILSSILIVRILPRLITGDKRAIASIERLIDLCPKMAAIKGRVMCLEQLVRDRLTISTVSSIKSAICQQPAVDKALFNCCSCSSTVAQLDVIVEGLESYIRSLRTVAGRTLCA
jgi:hypothetical protein